MREAMQTEEAGNLQIYGTDTFKIVKNQKSSIRRSTTSMKIGQNRNFKKSSMKIHRGRSSPSRRAIGMKSL
jgi:hypothetical protein